MAYPITLSQSLLSRRPKPGDPDYDPRLRSPYQDFSGGPSSDNPHGNWPLSPVVADGATPQYFDLPSAFLLQDSPNRGARNQGQGVFPPLPPEPAPRLSSGQPITLQPNPITGEVYRPAPAFVGPPDLTDLSPRALPASDPKSVAFVGPPDPTGSPLANALTRTFSGGSGTTTYGVNPDGSYTGAGDYRGMPFNTLAGAQDAASAWHGQQGARETGIAGTPSIESILSNQLRGTLFDGLDNGATERRLAAIGIQNKLSPLATALESQRIHGQYGMQVAEASRKDVIDAKTQEAALFNMQRTFELTGNEEMATEAYNRTMRMSSAGRRGTAGRVAEATRPEDAIRAAQARQGSEIIRSLIRGTEKKDANGRSVLQPMDYSPENASKILDAFAELPDDESRKSALQAMMTSGANVHELRNSLVRSLVNDRTRAAPLGQNEFSTLPDQYVDDRYNLPFNLASDLDQWDSIRRVPNMLKANPEAIYNRAILPTGEAIDLPAGIMASVLGRKMIGADERRRIEARLKAGGPLLESILNYGK